MPNDNQRLSERAMADSANALAEIAAAKTVTTIVPTWKACAAIIAMALENGTDEGKRLARIELARMAEAADRYNDSCKE